MKKIGFIGAGNMGGAIISGMIASGNFEKSDINVCDLKISQDILDLGINPASLDQCIANSDFVVLAVKPTGLGEYLKKSNRYLLLKPKPTYPLPPDTK